VRELRAQARSYELAVKNWATVPPNDVQVDAMFDLVTELHAKAVDVSETAQRPTESSRRGRR
jgi:hypothetical protein